MKLSTQAAVVISLGILAVCGLVAVLAIYADMDSAALIGLAVAASSLLGNLVVQLRSNAKLAEQDKTLDELQQALGAGQRASMTKLDTVVKQTNGLSDTEKQDIAERAAASVVQQFRRRPSA